jgi:two-component system sensor histidine kinase KdpD
MSVSGVGDRHALWAKFRELGTSAVSFLKSPSIMAAVADRTFLLGSYLRVKAWQIIKTLALVALTTVVYFAIDYFGTLNFVPIIYLIPVVIAATRWGTLPAVVASIAGFLASDYYFYPPYYSFLIDDAQEIVDLLLFLFVALVTGSLAARLRNEADVLRAREKELTDLYAFSRRLAACFTVPELINAIQEYLVVTLGRQAVLVPRTASADAVGQLLPEPIRQEAAALLEAAAFQARTTVDPASKRVWLVTSISTDYVDHGAIVVDLGFGSAAAIATTRRHVEAILREAMTRLTRFDLARAMNEANLRLQADQFKEALIGGVSHDLRTPIASILGLASVVADFPEIRQHDRLQSLVEAVRDEAEQLDGDIQNLLNVTRITKHGIQPLREWVDPSDIVNAAIKQKSHRLAEHRLKLDIEKDLPLVNVHSTMIEQAFGQLLENAAKYSKIGSSIEVSARSERDRVVLSVVDEGTGVTPEEAQHLFQRAFRSPRQAAGIPGSGLGLWISNTFVAANGGTLDITSRGAGLGSAATIRLPATAYVEEPEFQAGENE